MSSDRDLTPLLRRLHDGDPADRLGAVAALRARLDELETRCVADAIRARLSWTQIGAALGISKQAAHARHRDHPDVKAARRHTENGHTPLAVSEETRRAVQFAREEAARLGHAAVDTEHLLLGIVRTAPPPTADVLRAQGVSLERARRAAARARRAGAGGGHENGARTTRSHVISPQVKRVIERALRPPRNGHGARLEIDDLLYVMLDDTRNGAARMLARMHVSPAALRSRLRR
jgi:hypothetical protein